MTSQSQASGSEDWKAQLLEISRGAEESFKNAEDLFREATVLRKRRSLSRALFLHQISMEECAKVELLGAWASALLMGEEVNVAKLAKAFASHKAKNKTNAYMLEASEEEAAARQRSDWKGSLEAFRAHQERFHQKSNTAKNAALYVDFEGGKFTTPRERITAEMVREIAETNKEYLGLMYPKLKMLLTWNKTPDQLRKRMSGFKARLIELKEELPDDPEKALSVLLSEMLGGAKE